MSTSNLPANMNDLINALDKATTAITRATGQDSMFIEMTKQGEWLYGADDTEADAASEWVVNTASFFVGFQAWDEDGELLGEETALVTEHPIIKADLDDVGAPWKPMIGFQLLAIAGADKGTQAIYGTTSKGGIKAVNQLMKELVNRVKAGKHNGKLTPVIGLENDSYKHKKYGKIFTPVLEVIDWISDMVSDEPEPEPEPEQKATRVSRKKAEPEPEPEPEQAEPDEPVRRRRRRSV